MPKKAEVEIKVEPRKSKPSFAEALQIIRDGIEEEITAAGSQAGRQWSLIQIRTQLEKL